MKRSIFTVFFLSAAAYLFGSTGWGSASFQKDILPRFAYHADLLKTIEATLDVEDAGSYSFTGQKNGPDCFEAYQFRAKPKGQSGAFTVKLSVYFSRDSLPLFETTNSPTIKIEELKTEPNKRPEGTPGNRLFLRNSLVPGVPHP